MAAGVADPDEPAMRMAAVGVGVPTVCYMYTQAWVGAHTHTGACTWACTHVRAGIRKAVEGPYVSNMVLSGLMLFLYFTWYFRVLPYLTMLGKGLGSLFPY